MFCAVELVELLVPFAARVKNNLEALAAFGSVSVTWRDETDVSKLGK